MARTMYKDPDARLDYVIDWSKWLGDDTIVDSEWIVPDGLVLDDESFTTSKTVVWLTGGTAKTRYEVTNRITTSDGRIDDRTILIYVIER